MIYLDSCALVKLVRREPGSVELVGWLAADQQAGLPLVTSSLVEIEVPRALRRSAPDSLAGVPSTLARLFRLEIDQVIRQTAAAYTDPMLRSLNAIHLATAQILAGQLSVFVTYDKKLLDAAKGIGIATASPGAYDS
ncbi:MAG: type II toxin-antitoxin system VapC family toxin [Umezawaea sp.]